MQRDPRVQLRHAVLPESGVNLPAGQRAHASCLGAAPKEPAKQELGSAEPTEHDAPAGQTTQSVVTLLR